MASGNIVAYYRVSTGKQGRSGLGLEAQRAAVHEYLNGGDWRLVGEFVEVESGKRTDNRPELAKAMTSARLCNATLVIAKLDRLSRNAHFLLGLQESGVDFVAADMPKANKMTVGILAVVAQHEREQISARTKAALAAAKARGTKLGTPANLRNQAIGSIRGNQVKTAKADQRAADIKPAILDIQASGLTSLRQIATELNARTITTRRGCRWVPGSVHALMRRIGLSTQVAARARNDASPC
jgi:DNA invertase Pin-like site-specific DNA recombinase